MSKQDQEDVWIKHRWTAEMRHTDFTKLLDQIIYCIIRLRREEPGNELSRETWTIFKQLVEENLAEIARTFSFRWLVSIADTYADHAETQEERLAALLTALLLWGEKVSRCNTAEGIQYVTDEHWNHDGPRNMWLRINKLMVGMRVPHTLFVALQHRLLAVEGTNWNSVANQSSRDFVRDWKEAVDSTSSSIRSGNFVDIPATRDGLPQYLATRNLVRGVELGVAEGEFSEKLLSCPGIRLLYSIDRWAGDRGHDEAQRVRAAERLRRFGERSEVIHAPFEDAVSQFEDESLDFVYVDGYAHTGEDDGRHLSDWWSKIRVGGTLAGHDYSVEYPKVVRVVNGFASEKGLPVSITASDKYPSWLLCKA